MAGLLPGAVRVGWPALLSLVSDLARRARATALVLNNSAYYLGGALDLLLVRLAVGRFGIYSIGLPAVLVMAVWRQEKVSTILPQQRILLVAQSLPQIGSYR